MVDAARPYPDSPLWGHKLSREEALQQDLLAQFWGVVDWLLSTDPTVHSHVYRRDISKSHWTGRMNTMAPVRAFGQRSVNAWKYGVSQRPVSP